MEPQVLTAQARPNHGKGPARQLRSQGSIPAVFYGAATEPKSISVSPKELLKAISTAWRRNALIELKMEDGNQFAMVQDIQVHPVTREPLHVDFLRVSREREVSVKVPLRTEGRAIGVQKGGRVTTVFRELPVRAVPEKIPSEIVVNVSNIDIGQHVSVADLPLEQGVAVTMPAQQRVVLVEEKRAVVGEGDGTPEAGGAAAAAGAKATPSKAPPKAAPKGGK